MPGWVKLDPNRATHAKLATAGFAARGLDEAGMEQICQDGSADGSTLGHELDGFLPDARFGLVVLGNNCTLREGRRLAAVLCQTDVRRWERDDERGGYWIHDYLVQNKTKQWWDDYIAGRKGSGSQGGIAKAKARATAQPRQEPRGDALGQPLAASLRYEKPLSSDKSSERAEPASQAQRRTRKTSIPNSFLMTEEMRDWGCDHGFSPFELKTEAAACLDWHRGQGKLSADWEAAFRNWLRKDKRFVESTADHEITAEEDAFEDRQRRSRVREIESQLAAHRKVIDPDFDTISELETELNQLQKKAS